MPRRGARSAADPATLTTPANAQPGPQPPMTPAAGQATTEPRASIETRLAAAGLPTLARTAWLEIDLDALRANFAWLQALVGDDVRVEPVVKADAYGHGALPVATTLEAAGAAALSVATFDEALDLREGGVGVPILVLYPVPAACVLEAAWSHIAVSVAGGRALEAVLERAAANERLEGPPLEVHVEVDTGLGRGGVMPDALPAVVDRVRAANGVRLAGIWSHLASSEAPVAARQDEVLRAALGALAAGAADGVGEREGSVRRHLAASGGILGREAGRYDAVRPGISIYGLAPEGLAVSDETAETMRALRPVMRLVARPVRVEDLPAGHGVSYGPSFVTQRPSRIATLPLGYGDGWRRSFSDRTEALVRGMRVPLVGRVAMDAVMADVTDVPGPPVTEDDELVLLGSQGGQTISAHELADVAETISYEVVTAMSRRLARVYHAARAPVGLRTLAGGRSEWHVSSSGTGISATSRSTPS